MALKIYLASSWRNEHQPRIARMLCHGWGYGVYDFRHPEPLSGFAWTEVNMPGTPCDTHALRTALQHPRAKQGFESDMNALKTCDVCVLLLPCGRSAHLELGWAVGAGKRTAIFSPGLLHYEPELMYSMVDLVTSDEQELKRWLT